MLRKLASQTAIYGLGSIVGRGLYLLLTPILTARFAPAEYGLFSNCYSYIALLLVVLTFGMETTYFRFRTEYGDHAAYRSAFWWVAVLGTGVAAIALAFTPLTAAAMSVAQRPLLAQLSVVILWLDALTALPMARLRQQERAKLFTALSLGNTALMLTLNLVFVVVLKKDIEWVFWANVIASVGKLVAVLPFTRPDGFGWKRDHLKPMLGFGFYVMLAGVAGMMNENLDKVLIPKRWIDGTLFLGKARSGEELLGIYAACYKLSIFIALLTQAFRYAVEPFFFKAAGEKDSPRQFARIFHVFMLICLAGAVTVSAFAHEIVAFDFFGVGHFIDRRYWEGLDVVPILLAAYVCSAAYQQLSIWFKLTKQTRFALLFTGLGAVITIVGCYVTIPSMGFVGCAWATLICYGTMAVLAYLFGQRYYPIPYNIPRLLLWTLAALVVGYLAHQIGPADGEMWIIGVKVALLLVAFSAVLLVERSLKSGVRSLE